MKITVDTSKWWACHLVATDYRNDVICRVEVSHDNARTCRISAVVDHRPEFAPQDIVNITAAVAEMGLPARVVDSLNVRGVTNLTYGEHRDFCMKHGIKVAWEVLP